MEKDNYTYDPLRFQYETNTRSYSLRTKMMAIALVLLFCIIPLYEINEHTFPMNGKSSFYCFYEFSCFGFY
ncbi:hypothetical protein [Kordia sp.]|uniref:hypothetical protein n=1 Tax=Kordia sp. TaxID=1965332 RepID=UPI003B5C7180